MSNFNPNTQLPVQGVPQAQGIAPQAQQMPPQVGVPGTVGQQGDQTVNPALPPVQIQGDFDPTNFDPGAAGLGQIAPPEVLDHLKQWHQTVMQHHVAQLQSVKDREIAQLREQYRALQQNYHQYAAQVQPEYADYLEQQRIQAEYQERMQQIQPDVLEGQKFRALTKIVQQSGGAVRMEDLLDARNIHEARALAQQIAGARSRVPQIPPGQMNAGPSGGQAQAYEPPPVPGSRAWDNVWAVRAGHMMPHTDQESVQAAQRYLRQQGG